MQMIKTSELLWNIINALVFTHNNVRTCPYQPWQNVDERIMSTLNLALQNISSSKDPHGTPYEEELQINI